MYSIALSIIALKNDLSNTSIDFREQAKHILTLR